MNYYDDKLNAKKLLEAYRLATPRVIQYLNAEIKHVLNFVKSNDNILELGCGYGRVMQDLAPVAGSVFGVDTSPANLAMAKDYLADYNNIQLAQMNAVELGFDDNSFDIVVCVQNGISAFHVDQIELISESIRITRPGGIVLFSSYAERFWDDRLRWFEIQSKHGLLGEIDYDKTGGGIIICKDGFSATTVNENQFCQLTDKVAGRVNFRTIDNSSLFCEITKFIG